MECQITLLWGGKGITSCLPGQQTGWTLQRPPSASSHLMATAKGKFLMAKVRMSVYFYNFQNPWSRRSVAHGSTLPENKASTFCLSCWLQMFWNNCPDLLCYMLAFYPNVHLISIRMSVYMNRSQISSHFLHRHPSEGNSSPTLEHHPAGCLPLSKALRQVP